MTSFLRIANKKGTAIILALVAGTVLLQLAVIFTMQVRNSRPQTDLIDERVRLQFLANGLTEVALLKFQKYPADFYNCWRYREEDAGPLLNYTTRANEFSLLTADDQPNSSFNQNPIAIELATMTLATSDDQHWRTEVLLIRTEATYDSRRGRTLTSDSVRTVRTERLTNTNLPAAAP